AVGDGGAVQAAGQVFECDFGAGNCGAGFVNDGAADVAGVLSTGCKRQAQQNCEKQKSRARTKCFHDATSEKIELEGTWQSRHSGGTTRAQKETGLSLTTRHPSSAHFQSGVCKHKPRTPSTESTNLLAEGLDVRPIGRSGFVRCNFFTSGL